MATQGYTLRNTDAESRIRGRVGSIRRNEKDGRKVANVSVAFRRSWPVKDENGKATGDFKEQTGWMEFACWELAAERVANVEKGDIVECSFSMADIVADPYTDKAGAAKASVKVQRATVLLVAKHVGGEKAEATADEPLPAEEAI